MPPLRRNASLNSDHLGGSAGSLTLKSSTLLNDSSVVDYRAQSDTDLLSLVKPESPGKTLLFTLLKERDMPFLNEQTEIGEALRESLIDADMDDDVMTDSEMASGAKRMLERQLRSAIECFVSSSPSDKEVANLSFFERD